MSKSQVNTKSKNYAKDKAAFLRDLKQFNESKNIPFKIPTVNGIEIDLYLFYMLVQQRGGLSKVNYTDAWDSFLAPILQLPYPCINGSTLLRKIYGTYLEKYERAKAPAGRDDDNDFDEDPRRGRTTIQRVPIFGGGTYISASGEQLKVGNASKVGGPPERLALSLLSPMPNEQDFAVNVCSVLAADYANRLPLATTPHILDFLLAHAGVYNHSSLRETIGRSYYETRGRYPDDFWKLRSGGGGVKELADETKFMTIGVEQPELMVMALAAQNTLADVLTKDEGEITEEGRGGEEFLEDWMTEPDDESQLFASDFPGGASCVYTQRVLQVASIVRSLSFHEDNVHYLANNTTLIRFLLLCANCWVGALRQSGLDTLGNICTELVIKDPATCLISRHILSTIQSALVSQDRARVLAALEMLNKLSQNEANEDSLIRSLENKVYSEVCSLLTLRDIMVLVCTLECVYSLTCLGDRASEAVAKVPGLVNTLVCLVTVEAQSYGPRACILMRVVETVSGPAATTTDQQQQQQQPSTQQQTGTQQQAQQPQKQADSQPQVTTVTPSTSTTAVTVQPTVSTIQQSHMQQRTVQENEHFALAWLRSSYEPLPASDNSKCDAAEMYRQYMSCCSKLGRKGVIAPAHFPRLVRTVFGGTVGPTSVTVSSGETQQFYIGLKCKNPQSRTGQPAGPASPILKAQLTIKPATPEKPQAQQTQGSPHPHLAQALDAGASNTTLIKHLLAHKVSPATQTSQVAQRQQNQQRVTPATTNVIQNTSQAMEVDPEALIKCTAIIPGGVANNAPTVQEKVIINATEDQMLAPKEEPVQIQIDEQSQLTIKTAQNKMLADLLEKKSNPPVQVLQMGTQMNPPTIQITETGQIVQVKQDPNPVIQINESGVLSQGTPLFIKNEQGQLIQIKSDQIQHQLIQFKNDQGQIVQIKSDGQTQLVKGQMKVDKDETFGTDHPYIEPPMKKLKVEDRKDIKLEPASSVSKAAANLYAALAASTLEDEEDLMPPKQEPAHQEVIQPSMIVAGTSENQQPIVQVHPQMQVQQPTMQVQAPTLQVQQPTLQIQQPMLQVQPMDVQNIIASQSGQLILQEKPMQNQQPQFMQQQMQIIATPSNAQGGLSYITQNIPGNMMQKTIIIVQGTGGGPLTLTVNNSAGLDEATLNSVIAQATEAITQQQIIQNAGVIQSTQRVLVSQPCLVNTSQTMTVMKTGLSQNASQMTAGQQPIITSQPQPHKAQIINQQPQQIVVTQKQTPTLLSTSSNNQIIQGGQIIQSGSQIIQSGQQFAQQIVQGGQQIVQGGQQIIQGGQQIVQGGQQIVQGGQQIVQSGQQIIQVSSNQQIIMNAPIKTGIHRVMTPQRSQIVTTVQSTTTPSVASDNKPSVIQSNTKVQQQPARQVIARQPVMVGNTKIGDKEILGSPTEVAKPPTPKPTNTPPPQTPKQDETPWICHWRGCGKTFTNAAEVFAHAAKTHCPGVAGGEAPCLWLDCDRVPRKTFALLNHLTDKHCSPQALQAIFNSRRHIAAETETQKTTSVGYPPNAALQALNKHAQDMFNPRELMDENEGPVTKSIRLTAALILRNIVIYSNHGRRQLRSYESHLATIALSNVEASRTIAHVLYDMNNI